MVVSRNRVFRAPDDVYNQAKTVAAEDGVTLTSVLLGALRDYGDRKWKPRAIRRLLAKRGDPDVGPQGS